MYTDPIADMLTRIRNANTALHPETSMPSSKLKEEIARILSEEGFIDSWKTQDASVGTELVVRLRYDSDRQRVLQGIQRISKPGRRVYAGAQNVARVRGGIGVSIISTSAGVMTDRDARRRNVGGEILCKVW
ncbi:SSU ribosomal protein S8p (S15Ae) [hydrothermal vent metagenome]|uniref:SSU ribosomal protein S8p (S15Ae) n=1 Tax=hydrothermal vent metagenome TaxID=652676 RepID=A0A3B0SSC1_9ZZZZ